VYPAGPSTLPVVPRGYTAGEAMEDPRPPGAWGVCCGRAAAAAVCANPPLLLLPLALFRAAPAPASNRAFTVLGCARRWALMSTASSLRMLASTALSTGRVSRLILNRSPTKRTLRALMTLTMG
jgi:hypothetical protein